MCLHSILDKTHGPVAYLPMNDSNGRTMLSSFLATKRSDVTSCLISNNQNNSFSIPILRDCTRRRTGSLACCGSNDASGFALEQSDVASLSAHPHHRHMAAFVVRTRLFFWVLHVVGKAAHQLGLPGQIRRMMMDSHGQCNRQPVLP